MRGTITVASVLIGVVAAGACSDDDEKKNAKGNPDAGSDGSLGGDGGSAGNSAAGTGAAGGNGGTTGGNGGTTGGNGGTTGGNGGTTGGNGGTTGGNGGSAGTSGGTGGMALICNSVDAGATGGSAGQGTAGSAGSATGGAAGSATGGAAGSGPVGQWRDWDAWQCRDCPAPTLNVCSDFDLAGSSTFDLGTRIFTVRVKPGVAEVVSATYELDYYTTDADGGAISGPTSGSFTVDKDTLTADLSSTLPAEVMNFYGVHITVTDACGTTTNLTYGVINEPPQDGSPILNIHCEY